MIGEDDFSDRLEPLYDIKEDTSTISITIDLPFVNSKKDISIYVYGDTIEVTARTTKNIRWERFGGHQRHIEYREYRKQIKLPVIIDEKDVKAIFKNNILRIVVDKRNDKKRIKL